MKTLKTMEVYTITMTDEQYANMHRQVDGLYDIACGICKFYDAAVKKTREELHSWFDQTITARKAEDGATINVRTVLSEVCPVVDYSMASASESFIKQYLEHFNGIQIPKATRSLESATEES